MGYLTKSPKPGIVKVCDDSVRVTEIHMLLLVSCQLFVFEFAHAIVGHECFQLLERHSSPTLLSFPLLYMAAVTALVPTVLRSISDGE
jgi:hypothetical protein